jgi:hypothetical protein
MDILTQSEGRSLPRRLVEDAIHPRVAVDYFLRLTKVQLDAVASQMIHRHAGTALVESSAEMGSPRPVVSNLATLRG